MKKLIGFLLVLALLCAQAAMAEGGPADADPEDRGAPLTAEGEATAEDEAPEMPSVDDILKALGEGVYRETYDALASGEVIEKGSKGDAAKGVQQTLIAFGQDIAADGSAGKKTFGALNAVQAAFGLAETDSLDAEGYAQLLPRLLIATDEATARDLLYAPMSAGDADEYAYIRGCALALQGMHYSARRAFEVSAWGDWKARAEGCVQPWPKTGQLWRSKSVKGSGMHLTVQVNAGGERAMLVKVYTQEGELAATLFIGGTGKATTKLPGGTYVIKDGVGIDWYGPEEAFGDDGIYEVMTFDDSGNSEVQLNSGRAYTITINVQDGDESGTGVGSEYENWSDF